MFKHNAQQRLCRHHRYWVNQRDLSKFH